MYRSTEEMTARLKSLNLKLKFSYKYNSKPVVVRYNDTLVQGELGLKIEHIGQKEEIAFEGFTPDDPSQKISCTLEYNDEQVDMQSTSSFIMEDNRYVENTKIDNCKDVFFNGKMIIDFNKEWLRNNILSGANLDQDYCKWENVNFKNETVFCVGDSFTLGQGVLENETWPSLLGKNAYNFGSRGLSHDGCLKNVQYILKNSKDVRQIICLLPEATRKLLKFEFLGRKGCIPISPQTEWKLPNEYQQGTKETISFIMDKKAIVDDWIKCCVEMITICNDRNVECWLSTWATRLHEHIPKQHRLPKFPDQNTFTERATDNIHPHRKHYELFVQKIKPYVDKKQI